MRYGRTEKHRVERSGPTEPAAWLIPTLMAYSTYRRHGILPVAGGLYDQTVWVFEAFAVLDAELSRLEDEAEHRDAAWRKSRPAAA